MSTKSARYCQVFLPPFPDAIRLVEETLLPLIDAAGDAGWLGDTSDLAMLVKLPRGRVNAALGALEGLDMIQIEDFPSGETASMRIRRFVP